MGDLQRVLKGISGFADDMRKQGIYVGMGSDPRCVVDDEPWPCSHEREARKAQRD
jgi:hypothetical protein